LNILGISAFYHDSAAALLVDGKLVSAAQEERFTRVKHDSEFPKNAIRYLLEEAQLNLADIDHVVFYDKPFIKFERLITSYIELIPGGVTSFRKAIPVWLKSKLFLKQVLRKELKKLSSEGRPYTKKILFTEHHQAHAASAFFPSPFMESAVLCLDGVGEWTTTSVWIGKGNSLELVWEIPFPHSIGLLYSAFTYYCGFKVNSGEYKLMGLAPYGDPKFTKEIKAHLIDIKSDGTFRLNMDYFDYATGLKMVNKKFEKLFGQKSRKPESEIEQFQMDIAASIQEVVQEIVIKLGKTVRQELGVKHLCLAGGVALNCVANGQLKSENIFDQIWIQPAAGDAGGAVGAAFAAWYQYLDNPRNVNSQDSMSGAFLGPEFSREKTKQYLESVSAEFEELSEADLYQITSKDLKSEKIVGWFQGRMEFGPRALGGRSILGDARCSDLQSTMNLKIKFRESFRPFAPIVLQEDVAEYFNYSGESPYMLMVAPVHASQSIDVSETDSQATGLDRLKVKRSKIPAVTHVNGSARLQTVAASTNPRTHALLKEFKKLTGSSVLINTSFNVRGEPIVCTPEDAYSCFMKTNMDSLVLWPFYLKKQSQPNWEAHQDQKGEFQLD